MFCCPPRSGHTFVASILNAHPNVICSNQQFILPKMDLNKILKSIVAGTHRTQWNSNAYVETGRKQDIYLVGDKTGHRTVEHLLSIPEDLEKFKKIIPWPIKWIHIVRNPYDNLATWTKKNHESRKKIPQGYGYGDIERITQEMEFKNVFQKYKALNNKIKELKQTENENVLSMNHEKVIRFIDRSLDELCAFLEIEKDDDWRARVIRAKWLKPRITRRNIKWTPDMRAKTAKLIRKYPWFNGYAFGG